MTNQERNELVDMVAQAVIDKIDERQRVNELANMVVARVLQLQHEEKLLDSREDDQESNGDNPSEENV